MKTRRLLKQFAFCTGQCSTWHLRLVRSWYGPLSNTHPFIHVWCFWYDAAIAFSSASAIRSLFSCQVFMLQGCIGAAQPHFIGLSIPGENCGHCGQTSLFRCSKEHADACIINCVWSTWCQRVVNFSNQAQGNTTPTTPVLRIEKGSYLHQLPSCINVIGKGRVYSNSSLWSKFILLESKFIQHNVQHTVQHNIDSYGII